MTRTIHEILSDYSLKHTDHPDKMQELAAFVDGFFVGLEDESLHNYFLEELHDFTDELTKEKIEAVLLNLKRKDGLAGIKWSCDETDAVSKQFDIEGKVKAAGKHYDRALWWFAMNYTYAVHYNVNKSLAYYVDLSIDEYTNHNMCVKHLIKKLHKQLI